MIEGFPRTVGPRKTVYTDYTVLCVRQGVALDEDGVVTPVEDVDWRERPCSLVVGVNIPMLVASLHQRYGKDSAWQWRASDKSSDIGKVATQVRTVVDYFGWQAPNKRAHHYHRCIDALTFYANPDTLTDEQTDLRGLMAWALNIKTFCKENNLAIRSTASGIAAQFLRDPRFYPEKRRKVPKIINAVVREHLPGNCYRLLVSTRNGKRWHALEVDQRRAHHYHAEHTPLPDANTTFAFGDFLNLEEDHGGVTHPDFLGLYYLRLRKPRGGRYKYTSRWWATDAPRDSARFDAFIFSNELPVLRDMGFTVDGVIAGWGSRQRDMGVPAYARHCQSELDRLQDANWVKPILLTTYGLLAMRPRIPSAVFARSQSGEPFKLFAGSRSWLHGFLVAHTNGAEVEAGIVNVLHRAMIEAACRIESLTFADYLEQAGVKVLQVYADSVIVEDDASTPLPPLLDPWRVKDQLTDYQPINVQAFVSVEKTRLPGVPLNRTDQRVITARRGIALAPYVPRIESLTGRALSVEECRERGIPLAHL